MNDVNNWEVQYKPVIDLLRRRLGNPMTCSDAIDRYEVLLRSIWGFTAKLLGEAGAKAVVTRSINLAGRRAPLVLKIRAVENGIDFTEFRDAVHKQECDASEVMAALIYLGTMVFRTLSDLAGEALTEPLLRHLEEGRP